jgi:hypothetical protein
VADPRTCSATRSIPATGYERHRPEETLLYKTLQEHWRTFLSELESDGDSSGLPAFVVAEVEAFLRCGILAHGMILAKCRDCGWSRAVAFSCQRRVRRQQARTRVDVRRV